MTLVVLHVLSLFALAMSLSFLTVLVVPATLTGRKVRYGIPTASVAALSIALGLVVTTMGSQRAGEVVTKIEAYAGVELTDHGTAAPRGVTDPSSGPGFAA